MSFHVVKQVLDRPTGKVRLPDGREFSLRALALYHGNDETLAGLVVKNLRQGLATTYSHEPLSDWVKVNTWRYANGEHGTGSDHYFELRVDDPVESLIDASTSRFHEDQELFDMLTPEEIRYISSLKKERRLQLVTE